MAIRLPSCPCPFCKAKLDAASWVPDGGPPATPRPGDVTVCAYCLAVLMFDGDPLTVRIPTVKEFEELAELPEVREAQAALARHRGQKASDRS